jgi:dienelactone hydrolase
MMWAARVRRLCVVPLVAVPVLVGAQFSPDLVDERRADLQKQAVDPAMRREGGTQPQDWTYTLPEGVTTRQVTFYVDGGTPLYGKLFLPRGFTPEARYPAVAVGHGINALSIGIEKYAARFAERGLVAMAIDYRTYGWSGSDLRLLEPDPTTDERLSWERVMRVEAKRTNLNNFREVEDFRAAVSFLQDEPGVDPDRIGLWGSSNGGAVVVMTAAMDARVKAVVAQVAAVAGIGAKGPVAPTAAHLDDGIVRARTGQGAEADGGFSFRSKIDLWGTAVNREFRPGAMIDRVPTTTKILWLPAEKDELIPLAGPTAAPKAFRGVSQAVVLPFITHFQAYSGAAFEVGSTLAANWFLTHLGRETKAPAAAPAARSRRGARPPVAPRPGTPRPDEPVPGPPPAGVTTREVHYYSELVSCFARLYLPRGFSATGSYPAVVLAPGWGRTAATLESDAARFAAQGLVAMAIDYRGWGRSGGFVYPVDPILVDDRLRFSQHTARVRIQRRRLVPEHQVTDIRNALLWLQGEPGVDRARLGVWGVDRSAGHVITVAAVDARVKAGVAVAAVLPGKDEPATAWMPSGPLLAAEQRRARLGNSPLLSATEHNDLEMRIALAQYLPFQRLGDVPATTHILFVAPTTDETAGAASAQLRGHSDIVQDRAAAAEWLRMRLQ